MPPKVRGYGDFLTVHWRKSEKFPHGSISVTTRKNLCDGSLKYQNLLNKKVMLNAEGVKTEGKVVFQGNFSFQIAPSKQFQTSVILLQDPTKNVKKQWTRISVWKALRMKLKLLLKHQQVTLITLLVFCTQH